MIARSGNSWGLVPCSERIDLLDEPGAAMLVPDHATKTLFISALLPDRYPSLVKSLEAFLGDRLRTIPGTRDIWCRDYMPIQLASNCFVPFRYAPRYLKEYPDLCTDNAASLIDLNGCIRPDLVIDGGNIVRWRDTAVLTEKVYRENPGWPRPQLREELRRLLEVNRLIMIPPERKTGSDTPTDLYGSLTGIRFC